MPYRIDWEHRGAFVTYDGVVTTAEITNAHAELRAHPNSSLASYAINDFTRVQRIDTSAYDVLMIAAKDSQGFKENESLKVAVVTSDQKIGDLFDSKYAKSPLLKPYQIKIFYKVSDAREWVS